jgi:hypothetical protein
MLTLLNRMNIFKKSEKSEKNKTKIEALDYEINKLVYKLYGSTEEEIKIVEGR